MAREQPRGESGRGPVRVHTRYRKAVLLVAGLAVLAFLPSLAAGFIFDDVPLIAHNEYVHALKWLPRAFVTHLWDVSPIAVADDVQGAVETTRRYYRPLITVSFLLTWVVAGARPWVFHLTNVLLHAAVAVLGTRAAIRWTRSLVLGALVGGLFALHPTRTENVIWISGRMDVLMLLCILVALEAFTRFERLRRGRPRAAAFHFAFGLLAAAASVLCKEPAVMLPIVLLARDARPRDRADRRRSWFAFVTTGVICGGYAFARAFFWRPDGERVQHFVTPGHFFVTVGAYAQRTLLPWPPTMYYHSLAFDGPGRPIYPTPLLAFGVLVVVVAVAALAIAWRRSRTAFWLFVAAVAFIGPLLNLYYNGMKDTAQDRFLYAPLLFASAGAARLLRAPLRRLVRHRAFRLAVGGIALACIIVIGLRSMDYRTEESFWSAELAHHPDNPYAMQWLGRCAAARGDLETALAYMQRADRPNSRKYRMASDYVASHFQQAALIAALLPDGRIDDLSSLLDELWRIVDPASAPPRRTVMGLEVGAPLPVDVLDSFREFGSFDWDIALLATRTGDFSRAERVLSSVKPSRAAAHPLNGVLVLARLGRISDARVLARQVRDGSSFGDIVTASEIAELSARLDRAEKAAAARDTASSNDRRFLEAVRLAELGAYWSALRELPAGGMLDASEMSPLTLQLLVACRLDDAARQYAGRHMGSAGAAAVTRLLTEVPPRVRAMPAAPATLEHLVAKATLPP